MNEKNDYIIGFGTPKEQKDFLSRHSNFFERYKNLINSIEIAFLRKIEANELIDTTVFYLGRLCIEDFMEIMLLCGNGCGIGAMKILRGMYERAVTAFYLHSHPEETEDYLDYHWVASHKRLNVIEKDFGESKLHKDEKEELEREFLRVKDKYLITDCEKCGTTKLNFTWSKLHFVAMALKTPLNKLIAPAYYEPMSHSHSTPYSFLNRLELAGEGITFKFDAQKEEADTALCFAHLILLSVLDLQEEHFKYDPLYKPLEVCRQDFKEVWNQKKDS